MKQHVAMVCQSALFQLRKIGIIRKYLSDDPIGTLVHSFVTLRINYSHSLLVNLPNCVLSKLQKMQNVTARILSRRRDAPDISPVLIDIHFLPILLRICYKINLLTFKSCLHELRPRYLKNLLSPNQPERNSRSDTKGLLEKHSFKRETYGRRAHFVVGPSFWNDLPADLRFDLFYVQSQNPSFYVVYQKHRFLCFFISKI